jgi:hypothetical protein
MVTALQRFGCLDSNLVWNFDTKYYTAEIALQKYDAEAEAEDEAPPVEAILFLTSSAKVSAAFHDKIRELMEEHGPDVGVIFFDVPSRPVLDD